MQAGTFRRAFVVGAYLPDGGTVMAYHLGRILEHDFGIRAFAVTLDGETPGARSTEYDLRMPVVTREQMEQQITSDDVLIVNAGFSRFLFGWRIPGFKICYVQGFAQFNLLDRRLDHYVAVSDVVCRFLNTVYGISANVIPPFINLDRFGPSPDWSARPETVVLPYRKGIPDVWALSFSRLQEILATSAPHITLGEPLAGPMPQHELLSRIASARYLLMLSAAEGFGLVPLEAMAMGTLVVGYDGYGGRHYMRPGENCAVAPYAEIERVAALLIDAVADPAHALAMVERGRATAGGFTYAAFRAAWVKEFSAVLKMSPFTP